MIVRLPEIGLRFACDSGRLEQPHNSELPVRGVAQIKYDWACRAALAILDIAPSEASRHRDRNHVSGGPGRRRALIAR